MVATFLPLNIAQSFAAIQFIAVILASTLVLSEPIAIPRWIGIALIAIGIVIVGLTADRGVRDNARTSHTATHSHSRLPSL